MKARGAADKHATLHARHDVRSLKVKDEVIVIDDSDDDDDDVGGAENVEASRVSAVATSFSRTTQVHVISNEEDTSNARSIVCKAKSVSSTEESPPREPPPTSLNRRTLCQNPPRLGLAELITVSCDKRKQVYCQLCSVRLKQSSHVTSVGHHYNYVRKKYPWWTAKKPNWRTKLGRIAAHLAAVEKEASTVQRVTVKKDEYEKLAALPEDRAVQTLKAMISQRDSSRSTVDAAEPARREVAFTDSCDESSSDNNKWKSECAAGSRAEQHQSVQVQGDDQLHSRRIDLDSSREQSLKSDPEVQPRTPDTRAGVGPNKPPASTETLECVTESTRAYIQSAYSSPESPDLEEQQWMNDSALNTKGTAAADRLRSGPRPRPQETLTVGQLSHESSHLSRYLRVKGLDAEPIIGLALVWECRGISRKPFFLCESCEEMISTPDICQHMVTPSHQFNYMLKQGCPFLWFWSQDNLSLQDKVELLRDVMFWLSEQERWSCTDAQSVLMHELLHQQVQRASFADALAVVKTIRREHRVAVFVPGRAASTTAPHVGETAEGSEEVKVS